MLGGLFSLDRLNYYSFLLGLASSSTGSQVSGLGCPSLPVTMGVPCTEVVAQIRHASESELIVQGSLYSIKASFGVKRFGKMEA